MYILCPLVCIELYYIVLISQLFSEHSFGCVGWTRDFWRLSTYVKDANDDPEFLEYLSIKFRRLKGPRILSNWHRIVAQVLFGIFYRSLVFAAIPWESSVMWCAPFIIPLGTAFGTYMVSSVGRQKSSFAWSVAGAYLGELFFGDTRLLLEEGSSVFIAAVSTAFSTYKWEFRRVKEYHSFKKRVALVVLVYTVFAGLCCSFIYFNAELETEDGETIKVRDAIDNFLNSPAWQQIKTAFWVLLADIFESWRTGGYEKAWTRFKTMADIEGEESAYAELGLEPGASFIEIRKRYKELAKEWHPDLHQGEDMKLKAQERFIHYNNAYKILEKIHKRRKKYGEDEDTD